MEPRPLKLTLPSATLSAHQWGAPSDRPPVLCVPGLSANSWSFQALAEALAEAGRWVVALDLRGRGHSPATAPGTYGWPGHARDVLDAAAALGWHVFDCVGHSMGAFVTLQLLALDRGYGRVRRAVLIDALGTPDAKSLEIVEAGLARLGAVAPSVDAYVEAVRARGAIVPWHPQWERHYRYELQPTGDGTSVRARTSAAAVAEDFGYGKAHDPSELWLEHTRPVLAVRATLPLLPVGGHVFTAEDATRVRAQVPTLQVVEVAANHFGVMTHPDMLRAAQRFLDE